VLVTGGGDPAGSYASADIFDPATRTWQATAPMHLGRHAHTMTLLADGKVLVTGGGVSWDLKQPTDACETFDPDKNTWTEQAPLERLRCTHSATLLPDGRICVAGGQANWEHWTSVEFYSPGVKRVLDVGAMLDPRTYHAAVLMNDSEVFLVAGQQGLSAWCDKTEGFDLKSGTSRARAPMHIPRGNFSLTPLADGRLLVVGGFNRQSSWLRDAEVYDPKRDTWTAVPPLAPHGAANAATLLADGRVLVAGGSFGSGPSGISDHAEIFDPRTLAWTEVARLPRPLVGHSATLLQSGEVLIAGGNDGVQELATTFLYDPAQNRWQDLPGTRRASHMAVRLADGRVLVTGGHISGSSLGSAELFDPATRTWQAAAPMRTVRMAHTMTLLKDGKVLVTGGADRWELTRSVAACELYDPVRNTWTEQAPLEQPRCMHTATLLPDGRIFLAGGHQGNFQVSSGVEFYTPGAGL
jgi:N-acetylneuraminic acid mutarotase